MLVSPLISDKPVIVNLGIPILSKEEKKKQARQELNQIKKKYGLKVIIKLALQKPIMYIIYKDFKNYYLLLLCNYHLQ